MHRYQMDHSYTVFPNDNSSFDMNMDSNSVMGSHNPYQRFLSPSPTRSSISRRRSSSIPSSDYSDFLDASQHYRGRRHPTRHVRQAQLVNPDIIDRLDTASRVSYHHEGPYDAVYPERNKITTHSPLEALRESNAEALKATPYHKIADSIEKHRPLDGVAYFPPGYTDQEGQTYDYEEGYNMMTDYGNFARFPGLKFTDEDFRNDPFYNTRAKAFAPLRNVFRRKHRAST
ncbi:uncharacterized protein BJX67DRAFT_304192 [Aspergillus lucknowensis]|uniref:Pal1 cell morphology n=1 Tax=Aspergillus lucknowensis TaxID=176173 RepID=A0ABR4LZS7_9EURO